VNPPWGAASVRLELSERSDTASTLPARNCSSSATGGAPSWRRIMSRCVVCASC